MSVQRNREKKRKAPRFTLERILVAAIAVAVFALPLLMWPGLTDYNYTKSIVSLILISALLMVWGLTVWRQTSWTIRIPWLLIPVLGIALAGFLSLIQATNGRVVVQSTILLVYFVLLLWMIANVVRDQRDVRWLLTALFASGTLAALYGVLQYFGIVPGNPGETGVTAIISTMGNRNHLGGFLLYLFYPAVILLLRARSRWVKALVVILLAFLFAVMLLLRQTGVQTTLPLVAGALVVGWLIFRPVRTNRRWRLALAGAVIAVCVFPLILVLQNLPPISSADTVSEKPFLVRLWESNSGKTRAWDWWIGAEMFADHPITGVGLGNYKLNFIPFKADFLATERGQAFDFYIPRASQAHNEYIQIGAELGSVGLFMLFCSLGTLAVSLWIRLKRSNENDRLDLLLLAAGILAFLVHSLVSFPAHVVGSSLELIVFCGLALSLGYGESMTFTWTLDGWKSKALHAVLVVIAVSVSLFAIADLRANWLMERGIAQVQAGLYSTGETTLEQSLKLDFAPRQSYYYLAIAQIQLGKLDEAEENLEKCMTRFVDEASLLNFANLLVNTGQSERAFEPLDLLLASHPRSEIEPRARYLRALAISETGDPVGAADLIEELLVQYSTYETAYIGLGSIYEALERFDEARATYEQGVEVIDQLLARTRAAFEAGGGVLTAVRYAELRGQIEKLTYERATIYERLRKLPAPDTP
ncbi:O-antigen ligase family protein [Candidatus Bipolaricaulota bacterium]|nr:O-antigen ligase family protein [Candidatus Bipolaricaulota bacterium]